MKKLFSLDSFVFAVILLLPTYLLRFSILGFPTNFLEILIGIAFIWALFEKKWFINLEKTFDKKTWFLFGIIFLGLITSAIANNHYLAELGIIKGWFIFPIILALIAKKELSKEKIYLAIYLSASIVAVISLGYY